MGYVVSGIPQGSTPPCLNPVWLLLRYWQCYCQHVAVVKRRLLVIQVPTPIQVPIPIQVPTPIPVTRQLSPKGWVLVSILVSPATVVSPPPHADNNIASNAAVTRPGLNMGACSLEEFLTQHITQEDIIDHY